MDRLENVFQSGIHYVNHGKANFILNALDNKEMCAELINRFRQDFLFPQKLGITMQEDISFDSKKMVHIGVPDDVETLERIYDVIIGSRLKGKSGLKREKEVKERFGEELYSIEMEQVKRNGETLDYDIVLVLAYYLTSKDMARNLLWEKYRQRKEELVLYYKRSKYVNTQFLSFVHGKYMEQAICFIGLVLKCREQNDKEIYKDIINAMRRADRKTSNYIKKMDVVNGENMCQIWMDVLQDEDDVLVMSSSIIAGLIVAEALEKNILIDYDMGKYIMVAMEYMENFYVDWDQKKCVGENSDKNRHFLEKFKEEFTSNNTIHSVMYGIKHDQSVTELSEEIYYNYGISPRKFSSSRLSREEVYDLAGLSGSWNNKSYFMALQIAVLCKYICDLEEYIEDHIINHFEVAAYDLKEKETELFRREKEIETKKKEWLNRLETLEKRNKELEDELERAKRMFEEKIREHENEKTELVQLRNYIYKSTETEEYKEKDIFDIEKRMNFWLDQSVVLIGGCDSWQQKIRKAFPKWTYVTAGQKAFSPDMINDKKYIICNTDVLAHSVYYKVVANRTANQSLIFSHGRNIEKFLAELDGQVPETETVY